ncbi:MAG: ATP-binding protein, partial [Candidatus Rokuibacteriota bacterium]
RWDRRRLTLLRVALIVPPATDARLYPSRALELVVEKAESFGGRVEELGPTGIVAVFGLEPIEDAPRRAAHAAMAIRKAAERAGRGGADSVAVKLGIHVDHFLIGQGSGPTQIDLDGKRQAWTILETLLVRTEPDSISLSDTAASLLERRFDLVPLGPLTEAPGRVYRLAGGERAGLGVRGHMARFVGRREELELLQTRFLSTVRSHGHVVGIVGEAGIGKSRLLFEFRRATAGERVTFLAGRCPSYGSAIPYLPVLQVFRRFCGVSEGDRPDAAVQKVRLALEAAEMDPDEAAPYLLQFLGFKDGTEPLAHLSPEAIRFRTLARLRQMALQGSRRRPIVLVAEDLQWIDRSSEECLALLVESLANARVLVLCTYRPGYRPPWMDKSYASQVALQPLSPEDSLSVLRSVLRDRDLPDPLAQLILAKAEGNPFFLEELARTVDEEPRSGGAVPDTIEQVLRARMDRLPEEPRRLLQTASVLGREVPLGLLGALWDGPPLEDRLRELTRQEFLTEEAGGAELTYVFAHALTQEVAYQSLLPSDRQTLHAVAGRALEARYTGRLPEAYDRLSYHYSKAKQADKAIE